MNTFVLILLLSILDAPVVESDARALRRANRDRAIARNRRMYIDHVGGGIWFDEPNEDGVYRRHASGNYHTKSQQGRWATERLSGHRRFQKWCKDAYPSHTDEKAIRRWKQDLKDYFEE